MIDPCSTTGNSINGLSWSTDSTSILLGTQLVKSMVVTDVMSVTYGNNDGVTLCGPRVYTIVTPPANLISLGIAVWSGTADLIV